MGLSPLHPLLGASGLLLLLSSGWLPGSYTQHTMQAQHCSLKSQQLCSLMLPSWRGLHPQKAVHGSTYCAYGGRKEWQQVPASLLRASVWPQKLPGRTLARFLSCRHTHSHYAHSPLKTMEVLCWSPDSPPRESQKFERSGENSFWLDLLRGISAINDSLAKQPSTVR